MNIITIDFETYYASDYSLSKITTEEYLRDERFEVVGVAVQVNDGEPQWFSGTMQETGDWLAQYDWANSLALAHNAMFDGAILSWHFGIKPKGWLDTLSMARAIHGTNVGGSLKFLAEYYGVGMKGEEVLNALGKRRVDFSFEQLHKYGEYCCNDVSLTWDIFNLMAPNFPQIELRLIDLTLRMFTEPVLRLDPDVLHTHLGNVKRSKEQLMAAVEANVDDIMSNPKLAEVLISMGVEPPMKTSPTTGKQTYAFAKTDEAFKALQEHENPHVQAIVAARLGVKSTLEETRTERFIGIAERGAMPVPLRYYAAHTGRWGGDDKLNLQNLPRNSPLKRAIIAPAGYVMLDSDSSQIEARTVAWLAGQNDLVEAFDRGEDVYKIMASAIYAKPIEEITKDERFVGKTCVAEGTLVLSDKGWKPIETVTTEDRLWDGEEWVCHQGLAHNGIKKTLSLCGAWLTPDHLVWSGTQWLEAQSVVADEDILYRVLDTGAENLPSQATYVARGTESKQSLLDVIVEVWSTPSITKTLRASVVLGAPHAQGLRPIQNGIGSTQKQCLTMNTAQDYSTACPPLSAGATTLQTERISTTVSGASRYARSGETIEQRFSSTYRLFLGGITQRLKWIVLTLTAGMRRATSVSYREAITSTINGKSQALRNVYDILNCGSRNRFTILTDAGPAIVHNCVLGCGYGMGAAKFKAQLKTFNVEIDDAEAQHIITTYRTTYPMIPQFWKAAQNALPAIMADQFTELGRDNILKVEGRKGILLPNGLYLKYPNLRKQVTEDGEAEWVYDTRKGKGTMATKVYGGKLTENICQALARIAIGEQMLLIAKKYKVVMTVHDAIACIVPEDEADRAQEYVELCMRIRPKWAPELPLNCEAGYGVSYAEC